MLNVKNTYKEIVEGVQNCIPGEDSAYVQEQYRKLITLMVLSGVSSTAELMNLDDDFSVSEKALNQKKKELEDANIFAPMLEGMSDKKLIQSVGEFRFDFPAEPEKQKENAAKQQEVPAVEETAAAESELQNRKKINVREEYEKFIKEVQSCKPAEGSEPSEDTEYLHEQYRKITVMMLMLNVKNTKDLYDDNVVPDCFIDEEAYLEKKEELELKGTLDELFEGISDRDLIRSAPKFDFSSSKIESDVFDAKEAFRRIKKEFENSDPETDTEFQRQQIVNMTALYEQSGVKSVKELEQSEKPILLSEEDYIQKQEEMEHNAILNSILNEKDAVQLQNAVKNFDSFMEDFIATMKIFESAKKKEAELHEEIKKNEERKSEAKPEEPKPEQAKKNTKQDAPEANQDKVNISISNVLQTAQMELVNESDKLPRQDGVRSFPEKSNVRQQYATIITAALLQEKTLNDPSKKMTIKQFEKERDKVLKSPEFRYMMEKGNDRMLYLNAVHGSGERLTEYYKAKSKQYTEEEIQKSKDDFRKEADGQKERIHLLTDRFGPNAKIIGTDEEGKYFTKEAAEKYNSIKLPVPEGMTPEMVSIIALGNAMDKTRYDFNKKMTASSRPFEEFHQEEWNRSYIYTSIIPQDSRSRYFSDIMADSREVTQKALEAYQNKDYQPVQHAVSQFCDMAKSTMLTATTNMSLSTNEKQYYKILNEMSKIPELKVKENFSPTQWARIQTLGAQVEGADRFYSNAAELMEKMPQAGSEERKQLAFDLLLNAGIMQAEKGGKKPSVLKLQDQMCEKFGKLIDPPMSGHDFEMHLQKHANSVLNPDKRQAAACTKLEFGIPEDLESRVFPAECFSPAQGYLAYPDGRQQLSAEYKNAIENSPLYKKLVNETNPLKLSQHIEEAKDKDFTTYNSVKLNNSKAKLLESDKSESNRIMREWDKGFHEEFAHQIGPKLLDKNLKHLNDRSFKLFSSDTPENRQLDTLCAEVRMLNYRMKKNGQGCLEKDEVKQSMQSTYDLCASFMEDMRKKGGAGENDLNWLPKSSLDRKHYKAAKEILKYTEQFVVDKEKSLKELEAEEKAKEAEAIKRAQEKEQNRTFEGNSMCDQFMQKAMQEVSNAYQKHTEACAKSPDGKDAKTQKNLELSIAKVVAVRTVTLVQESAEKNGFRFTENDFNKSVKTINNEIHEREDFKVLLRDNKLTDLVSAASKKGGKELMMKLADAGKTVDREAKQAEAMQKAKEHELQKNNKKDLLMGV